MPIARLLAHKQLPLDQQHAIELAFNYTLIKLSLVDRNDPICDMVARKVIDIGTSGVTNAVAIAIAEIATGSFARSKAASAIKVRALPGWQLIKGPGDRNGGQTACCCGEMPLHRLWLGAGCSDGAVAKGLWVDILGPPTRQGCNGESGILRATGERGCPVDGYQRHSGTQKIRRDHGPIFASTVWLEVAHDHHLGCHRCGCRAGVVPPPSLGSARATSCRREAIYIWSTQGRAVVSQRPSGVSHLPSGSSNRWGMENFTERRKQSRVVVPPRGGGHDVSESNRCCHGGRLREFGSCCRRFPQDARLPDEARHQIHRTGRVRVHARLQDEALQHFHSTWRVWIHAESFGHDW